MKKQEEKQSFCFYLISMNVADNKQVHRTGFKEESSIFFCFGGGKLGFCFLFF